MSDLPRGWALASLGELGQWKGGGTPSKSIDAYWCGDIPWVSPKDMKCEFIEDSEDHITEAAIAGSATQIVDEDSILVVTRSGILKHSLPVAINTKKVAINQDIKSLTPSKGIYPAFIALQLRSDANNILSQCAKSGTTVDSIDFNRLKNKTILIAPEKEQRRIVAKVDALLAHSKSARGELDHVPMLVEHYKRAILEKAFSGELTSAWRARQRTPLPKFVLVNVGSLVSDIRYGTAQKCFANRAGTAVLRIPNVSAGRIDLADLKYAELSEKEKAKLALCKGDILIIRSNGSVSLVGRPAVVTGAEEGLCYAGYLIRIRPKHEVVAPEFLKFMLESPQIRRVIETSARSTSGVHNVNSEELAVLQVPCPPLAEQHEILRRIQSSMAWSGGISSEQGKAAALLDSLDHSLLSKAFRGELVAQDQSDEPAGKLLDRLRAGRGARPKSGQGRRTRSA